MLSIFGLGNIKHNESACVKGVLPSSQFTSRNLDGFDDENYNLSLRCVKK